VVVAVPRLVHYLHQGGCCADWGTTEVSLPPGGAWQDLFTGSRVEGRDRVRASELLADFAVCVLVGDQTGD
jgi:maltooligosyltrehalose synthase